MGKVEQDLGLPPCPALQGSAAHQRSFPFPGVASESSPEVPLLVGYS